MPDTVQQIAGGEAWIAIPEPAGLPSLDALLPYVGDGPAAGAVALELHALAGAAREARLAGNLERAAELDGEAVRFAVGSLERTPGPALLYESLRALDEWSDRVETGVDLRVHPEIGSSLRLVRRSGDAAREAVERGDTAFALLRIMHGAEAIRAHSPTTVALRVLGQAESRLRGRAGRSEAVERAIHLLRSARRELVAGDGTRALRRALYALQLLEGRQLAETGARTLP